MKVWTNECWTNDTDVVYWLEEVLDKKLKQKDVAANILRDFGRKFSQKAISNHVPTAEGFKKEQQKIISINSKQFGKMKAVQRAEHGYHTFRISNDQTERNNYYICYHCGEIKRNLKRWKVSRFECQRCTKLLKPGLPPRPMQGLQGE